MKVSKSDKNEIKMLDGIYRTTLAHHKDLMIVHFRLEKGAKLPMHDHPNVQGGYIVKGKMKLASEKGELILGEGDSYMVDKKIPHEAIILEDTIVIDAFTPRRDDYMD